MYVCVCACLCEGLNLCLVRTGMQDEASLLYSVINNMSVYVALIVAHQTCMTELGRTAAMSRDSVIIATTMTIDRHLGSG